MHTQRQDKTETPVIDRQALQSLGVLVPIRFNPVKVLPGRHPLGRSGDGMRLLRTRPYVAGEDNPRDIDKYSPSDRPNVIEWEDEAQAPVVLLADMSASMITPQKAALRNACLMQLTYSLWRAGDRVSTILFDNQQREQIRAANLKTQMKGLVDALAETRTANNTDIAGVLSEHIKRRQHRQSALMFVVSDFVDRSDNDISLAAEWQPILNSLGRNIVPVIITFKVSADMQGMTKLWDAERGARRLTWFSRRRIRDVNQQEQERVAKLVNFFRSAGLDHLLIREQRQVYPQLVKLARHRRQRKY